MAGLASLSRGEKRGREKRRGHEEEEEEVEERKGQAMRSKRRERKGELGKRRLVDGKISREE